MRFYTTEDIGRTRSLTPEGFLLCRDAVLARTGTQLYGPGETPLEGDAVQIERDPEEVFAEETIASAQGKPVVNEHPMDASGLRCDVDLSNWRDLAIGTIINPRRGTGVDDDVLVADLLITDADAIDLITKVGKRELSCGYDAEYEEVSEGHGRQTKIRINHVALVDQGRCGPRCAIGDALPPAGGRTMKLQDRLRRILRAHRTGDDDALERELDKAEEETKTGDDDPDDGSSNANHVHLHMGGGAGGGNGNGGNGNGDPDDDDDKNGNGNGGAVPGIEEELEELWQAHEMEANALNSLSGNNGGDRAFFRDAKFPHRDARRKRMGIRPSRDQDPDDKREDDDEQVDDEGFRAAPGAGGLEQGMRATAGGEMELEAPAGTTKDQLRRARDSALFEESFADVLSMAEIIIPGVRLPTFDRRAAPRTTVDQLCAFRARVLDMAYTQPDLREMIDEITASRFTEAKRLGCSKCRDTFRSLAAMKRRANNAAGARTEMAPGGGLIAVGGELSSLATWQSKLDEAYRR